MPDKPEPPDRTVYNYVSVYRDTFVFLKKALTFYRDLVKKELEELTVDDELKEFISARPEQAKAVESEVDFLDRILKFFAEQEKATLNPFDYELGNLSHGRVRYLKSIGLLYLAHLRNRRNEIATRRNLSKHMLAAIDEELARREETINTAGVFGAATPIKLLVDQVAPPPEATDPMPERPLTAVEKPRPLLLDTIPILDPILKARCLDLFSMFHESDQHDRFDTVVSDATRILEDRMRAILGEDGKTGDDLAVACFGGTAPKLQVSTVSAEQQGVLLLFKGIFSHIRNPVHHKLHAGFTPERTLQIMGLVDYALHVLETAVRVQPPKQHPKK